MASSLSNSDCAEANLGEFRIAVVGGFGSGKSTFIQAVLNHSSDAKGLANNTWVSLTPTCVPQNYPHPKHQNIKLGDLPGYGMTAYQDVNGYLNSNEHGFEKYDAYLLLVKTRFSINDQRLAERIADMDKPFCVIRTFIDEEVKNQNTKPEDELLKEIRKDIEENLKHLNLVPEIFLISNIELNKWDFDRLNNFIISKPTSTSSGSCFAALREILKHRNIDPEELGVEERFLTHLEKISPSVDFSILGQHCIFLAAHRKIEEELDRYKNQEISIAVIGKAGAGKSSFINALRGLENSDPKAAKAGSRTTTKEPIEYSHPKYKNITLWDLPGCGVKGYPNIISYIERVNIERYDAFIVVTSDRFTHEAWMLATIIDSFSKPFFFVRTKIDQECKNAKRDKGKSFDEEKLLEEIRKECSQELKMANPKFNDNNIFLISNFKRKKWDFARLNIAIQERLPCSKQETFIFAMEINSPRILDEKVKTLKGRVWWHSLKSKVRYVFGKSRKEDCKAIAERVESYRSELGFRGRSSNFLQVEGDDLQARAQSFYQTSQKDVDTWYDRIVKKSGEEGLPFWLDVEKAINKRTRTSFVKITLIRVLDEMKKVAPTFLEEEEDEQS